MNLPVSNDLKRRGMKYVGSIIIYSYLQAIGIINGTPTKDALYPIVRQLINLLPETSVPANANNFGLLRRK